MDLQGILGVDPDVRNGFSGVRVDYRVDADATPAEIEAASAPLHERVAALEAENARLRAAEQPT